MPGERRLPSWLPWALCWISLALHGHRRLAAHRFSRRRPTTAAFYAVVSALGIVLVPLVGALIAARLPTNPYGWLWCALGLALRAAGLFDGLRRAGAVPGWLGVAFFAVGFDIALCLLVFVLLLFPTGRLPSAGWRWLARTAVLVTAAAILLVPFAPPFDRSGEPGPWAVGGGPATLLAERPRRQRHGAVPPDRAGRPPRCWSGSAGPDRSSGSS